MISPLPSLTTPPAAAPAPPAAPSPAQNAEHPHAFARQLQDAQGQDAPAPAAVKPASAQKAGTPNKSAPTDRRSRPETDDAEVQPAQAHAAQPGAEAADGAASEGDAADAAPTEAAGADAGSPDLAALMAQLRGHTPPAADAKTGRGQAGGVEDPDGSAPGRAAKSGLDDASGKAMGPDATRAAAAHGNSLRGAGRFAAQDSAHEAAGARFKEQMATAQLAAADAAPSTSATPPADASALSAAGASALAAAAGRGDVLGQAQITMQMTLQASAQTATQSATQSAAQSATQAPTQSHLPAALGSADFAPQLGSQITTFVREGVHHAQLHLNPADMGPVTVQIQLDGAGAQVHLQADQALTRQALEEALPQLASSLREAGLTLTGGGVFQQPRQTSSGDPGASGSTPRQRGGIARVSAAGGALDGVDTQNRSLPLAGRRGLVDLVA
jgi:flagellar hook-length control protein FliK